MRVTTDKINYHDVDDIIMRFGKDSLVRGVSNGLYSFELPSRETLKKQGFSSAGMVGAMKYLRQGRPLEHISKTSGRIKREFHGITFKHIVEKMEAYQSFYNMIVIADTYDKFSKAFKKHVEKKFKNIDLKIDPITCEEIHIPVYLKTDWEAGSKQVYDLYTITKLGKYEEIPYLIVVHPETNEEFEYCNKRFVGWFSPFTRKEFTVHDVRPVPII